MNGHLQTDKIIEIFLPFFGIFLHHGAQRLSLDVLGDDRPLSVRLRDLIYGGDVEIGLLRARLIERFVQHVRLGIAAGKDLDDLIVSAQNRFIRSEIQYFFHKLSPFDVFSHLL